MGFYSGSHFNFVIRSMVTHQGRQDRYVLPSVYLIDIVYYKCNFQIYFSHIPTIRFCPNSLVLSELLRRSIFADLAPTNRFLHVNRK